MAGGYLKTVLFKAPYIIEICNTEMPVVRQDEVLVKVAYAGLCGTDIDIYQNKTSFKINYPIICGHEWSGVVEKVGSKVQYFKKGS